MPLINQLRVDVICPLATSLGWDKELDCTGLAERLNAARERMRQREERGEALEHWTPIYIPPGKENTFRGRLAARINAGRARVRQYEAGDYPLRSSRSRAAARHALTIRRAAQDEGTLLSLGHPPSPDQQCTCAPPPAGTVAVCRCSA